MSDRHEDRLRSALLRRALPPAPEALQRRLATITATTPDRSTPLSERFGRPRLVLGLAAVLAGTLAVAVLGPGGDQSTTTDRPPITSVDGLLVMTVSEAIAARDAGSLPGGRAAIRGFWSAPGFFPSCPAPLDPTGELEMYCHDGWFGITERNAPILGIERTSTGGMRTWQNDVGPRLTPWVTPGIAGADELNRPMADGQVPEPVPIIVVGHFDDPRAADCRAEARQLCRDRLVLDRIVQLGTEVMPTPLVPPDPTPSTRPSDLTEVDGLPLMTVSEALAAHEAGELPDGRVAMRGYWTNYAVGHSCVPPQETPGELEIYCHDGEYGITERAEPIWVIDIRTGQVTYTAQGPHLTPWLPNDLADAEELFALPFINGQWYPPVPIVVVGHFDDPKAKDCRVDYRELCRDRLVVDRIVEFDPGAVPTPGVTPSPTPFQSPWPAGLFDPEECAGDVPYTFVGWTTFEELGIDPRGEGHIWVAISQDPVDRSGEWIDGPAGLRYRHFARVICYRWEWESDGVMSFESVADSEEIHWEDGLITPGNAPVRPAATD
jgi:hypothetical protein